MSTPHEIENLLATALDGIVLGRTDDEAEAARVALAELIVDTAHPEAALLDMPGILHRAAQRMQDAL